MKKNGGEAVKEALLDLNALAGDVVKRIDSIASEVYEDTPFHFLGVSTIFLQILIGQVYNHFLTKFMEVTRRLMQRCWSNTETS